MKIFVSCAAHHVVALLVGGDDEDVRRVVHAVSYPKAGVNVSALGTEQT